MVISYWLAWSDIFALWKIKFGIFTWKQNFCYLRYYIGVYTIIEHNLSFKIEVEKYKLV